MKSEIICALIGLLCSDENAINEPVQTDIEYKTEFNDLPKPKPKPKPLKPGMLNAPDQVDFGRVKVGMKSKRQIVLANKGQKPLTITALALSGNPQLSHTGNCAQLNAGAGCRISVMFTPETDGPTNGTLLVGTGDGSIKEISLAGVGFTPQKPAPAPKPEPEPEPEPDYALLALQNHAQVAMEGLLTGGVIMHQPDKPIIQTEPLLPDNEELPPLYRLRDKEYPSDFKRDESTFPVERCRMIPSHYSIPLALDHSYNTQIGGKLIAHVTRDVYGPDGRLILLPQGTRFEGSATPLKKAGDSRVNAEFTLLTRNDGARIKMSNTYGADIMGRPGLVGEVDNRYLEKYMTVVGASAIGAVMAYITQSGTDEDGNSTSTFSAAGQSLQQSAAQVTADALRNSANLAPRVTLPKGEPFIIYPGVDWYFPNAYEIQSLDSSKVELTYSCNEPFFALPQGKWQNEKEYQK